MTQGPLYVASSLRISHMEVLSPSSSCIDSPDNESADSSETPLQPENAAQQSPTLFSEDQFSSPDENSSAVTRILKATSEAYSRWFTVVRNVILRDRIRQQYFREEHELPKSARIPYQRQPLTATELAIAESSEAVIRALYGDSVADYAHEKFYRAIDTGDMRAFKIRLLILKARDSMQNTVYAKAFVDGIDVCISRAEKLAGCKPDPSPRRLSRAEQERKRIREEKREQDKKRQPELNLVWPNDDGSGSAADDSTVSRIEDQSRLGIENQYIENGENANVSSYSNKNEEKADKVNKNKSKKDVTVTDIVTRTVTNDECNRDHKGKKGIVRKAREYDTVDQIIEDIDAGKIVPYESSDEICSDLKSGKITDVDAIMFVEALDRYLPQDTEMMNEDMARDLEQGEDPDEMEDFDAEPGEEDREYDRRDSRESTFSYNPRGFGGCDYGDDGYGDDD